MKQLVLALPLAALGLGAAPTPPPAAQATLTVRNPLALARRAETISLPLAQLPAAVRELAPASLRVRDGATKQLLVSQLLDNDGDGQPDALLFQTDMPARGTKTFMLAAGAEVVPTSPVTTFARFVPERTDDFAWENERVAFRTYGPNAEQLFDKKDPAGTLSSGMDCWLKRVSYPIIDKWYAQHVRTPFSYHKDTGEGYDPYHVGTSRGVGGTGVLDIDGEKLYVSRNFATYKVLATGPIRTVFELTYAPWDAAGREVTEKKIISLDLGSNLTRYEELFAPTYQPMPNCTIGLTLHEAKGAVKADRAAGWFRYWEAVDDSFLGTGVVVAPAAIADYEDHRSPEKDANQLYIVTKPRNNTVVFYAGFGWTKSGQFSSAAAWDAYLAEFAQRLALPLKVSW